MARFGMSRRSTAILSAIVTAALIAGIVLIVAGPATAKEFATLHPLSGTVEVRGDGEEFAPGTEGQTLRQGDTVRTGSDGRAEIEYFDGSVTRLDFDTTYELVELASLPDVPDSKLIRGGQPVGRTFHRVAAITDSESRVETETPNAVASVRGTEYVIWVHPGGTEEYWVLEGELLVDAGDLGQFMVRAGEGLRISGNEVEGPFPLTEIQLEDAFLVFNRCELDGEEDACPAEVEPEVERRNDRRRKNDSEPPPSPPSGGDAGGDGDTVILDETGGGATGGGGGGGGTTTPPGPPTPPKNDGNKDEPDPIDRRPITITLQWSQGPSDLDLHVVTPHHPNAEGGEVWWGDPCLAAGRDFCWARATQNSTGYGSETVTLRPIGDEWVNGGYQVWVENVSCDDGDWTDSDATVTLRKGKNRLITVGVQGAFEPEGPPEAERWLLPGVGVDRNGFPGIFGEAVFQGKLSCGPPEVALQAPERRRAPAGPTTEVITEETPPAADEPTEAPPAEEPPTEEPPPTPEPEPSPEPEPAPDVEPTPVLSPPVAVTNVTVGS